MQIGVRSSEADAADVDRARSKLRPRDPAEGPRRDLADVGSTEGAEEPRDPTGAGDGDWGWPEWGDWG